MSNPRSSSLLLSEIDEEYLRPDTRDISFVDLKLEAEACYVNTVEGDGPRQHHQGSQLLRANVGTYTHLGTLPVPQF